MIITIKNKNNIVEFAKQLLDEGTNVYPDDNFNDYINTETDLPSYTFTNDEIGNNLMNKCFERCELNGLDIYDIFQEVYLKETELDKLYRFRCNYNTILYQFIRRYCYDRYPF